METHRMLNGKVQLYKRGDMIFPWCPCNRGKIIYQIAKNCRTSVEMIKKFYAAYIKSTLDAASINVRRPKPLAARKVELSRVAIDIADDE